MLTGYITRDPVLPPWRMLSGSVRSASGLQWVTVTLTWVIHGPGLRLRRWTDLFSHGWSVWRSGTVTR